jgi:transposase
VSVLVSGLGTRFDLGVSGVEDLPRDELIALVGVQAARITAAEERFALLLVANQALIAKVAKLEHLLSRNSSNSSSPPSKDDQPGRQPPKPKSRREPVDRAKGKQKGAPGTHMAWSDSPDQRRDRFPEGACECGHDLSGAADLGVVDRFQQIEIPLVVAELTQFDQHAVRCRCGKVHTATRPEGARSGPVGYGPNLQAWAVFLMVVHHLPVHRCVMLLESLTGAKPSVGFVHGMLARTATALSQVHQRIRALIALAHVVVMDETPLRVGRKKADKYLLVACTDLYTSYLLGDRDLDTFKASVLEDLAAAGAVVVHDRYHLYDNPAFAHTDAAADADATAVAGVLHQLCCQHLCRDLDDAAEVYPDQHWPTQIAKALRGLIHARNHARHDTRAAGHDVRYCRYCTEPATTQTVEELLRSFRHGVLVGLSATLRRGDRPGERKARLLLECLHDRQDDVLRFLADPLVAPTSNDAERELRPSKIQQNISGRLTSEKTTQDRYTILGYLTTAAKHGRDKMSALRETLLGRPWTPEQPALT